MPRRIVDLSVALQNDIPSDPPRNIPVIEYTNHEQSAALVAGPGRFWLHVDLDALSTEAMPAVDYLLPGGLDWDELAALLRPLATSPALLGMDVTIYNPSLDPGRRLAPRIVELLAEVLRARA